MTFLSLRYHRNGCFGAGFYAVRLEWEFPIEGRYRGTAIVYDADEHVAVIADGEHGPDIDTCWRHEDFAAELRAYVSSNAAQAEAFR